MPRHFTEFTGSGAAEFSAFNRERRQWLLDRGVNPGDWAQFYPILQASAAAHGVLLASDRARLRLKVADPDLFDDEGGGHRR